MRYAGTGDGAVADHDGTRADRCVNSAARRDHQHRSAGRVDHGRPGKQRHYRSRRSGFTRLVLNASGAVTQNASLGVTTLAGVAGSVALADVGNFITALDGLTATGAVALHTSSGLTVSNAVTAGGNLTDCVACVDDPLGARGERQSLMAVRRRSCVRPT